jgi:hypothetical protein
MDIDALKRAVAHGRIEWRKHCLLRLAQRGIRQSEVLEVLKSAKIVMEYAEDRPFASALFSGFEVDSTLRVVASYDESADLVYIITTFRSDEEIPKRGRS